MTMRVRLTQNQIGKLEDTQCKFRQAGKTVVVFACAEDVRDAITRTAGLHPDNHDAIEPTMSDLSESQERFAQAQIARSVDSLHEKLLTLLEGAS
mgnify:CR=1 FL=1